MTSEKPFRVIVFSSAPPATLVCLISRLEREIPAVQVVGQLYEQRARTKPLRRRFADFVRNLKDPSFVAYAVERIGCAFIKPLARIGTFGLRLIHAGRLQGPTSAAKTSDDLATTCAQVGCALHVTDDIHSPRSLDFVRELAPDLGLVYGTRILKPALFDLPRLGSINIHQRKVPDYRGGGPIGLWELLDDRSEIGVTVHRVAEAVDTGDIIRTTTIPIERYDDLESLALKADVVGCDLLIESVRDFASGSVRCRPQEGDGKSYRNPKPQELRRYRKQIAAKRPGFRPRRGRSIAKLAARSVLLAPYVLVRNWLRRARGTFPIIVLYHHVITDKEHCLGIPTSLFHQHVRYLRRHYRVVDFCNATELLKSDRVSEPTVVLTFDDGYQDNFLNLRAILKDAPVPVTMFVCTGNITEQREFDHDVKWGLAGFTPFTWNQVKTLDRENVRFGSHTHSHFDCGSSDTTLLKRQIVDSKAELEAQIGHPVTLFSFPWGLPPNMSSQALELARQTYTYVCSAFGGANFPARGNPQWHVRRCPHPDSLWELELTLQSILDFGSA